MSLKAYQKTQRALSDPRDTEYRLFAQITAAMIEAKGLDRLDARFIDAVSRNRQLWAALSSDCADPANALPEMLRAQIISLDIWVTRYTSAVIRTKADISPLIDVNRSIMEGLALRRDAASQAGAAAQAPQRSPTQSV